jgi:hypothetical protein
MVAIIGAVAVARGHHKSDERGARPPVAGQPLQKNSQLGFVEGDPVLAAVSEIEALRAEEAST